MSINRKFYSEEIKNINKVSFSIFSNDEIKKYSSVKKDPFGINVPDSYDNYEPKKGVFRFIIDDQYTWSFTVNIGGHYSSPDLY